MQDKALAAIINTCNRPYLLKNLVSQIEPQLKEDDTIIIVNDGDEGSVHKLGLDYPTILHCKDYYALASGRNKGMKAAIDIGYKWGIFIDDDMEVSRNFLEAYRENIDNSKYYQGKITAPNTQGEDLRWFFDRKILEKGFGGWINSVQRGELAYGGANILVCLSVLEDTGGWDEEFDGDWGWEDRDLTLRMIDAGYIPKYVREAKMHHRKAPTTGYLRENGVNKILFEQKHPAYIEGDAHGEYKE